MKGGHSWITKSILISSLPRGFGDLVTGMGSLQPTEQLAGENPMKQPPNEVFVMGCEALREGMEEQPR